MQWVEFVSLGWWAFLVRWLHIISGVMWIGHLWYFNFTQTPTVPKIPQELRPAVVRYILPEARNEPDLTELPPEVRKDVRFVPVDTLEEVLEVALPR